MFQATAAAVPASPPPANDLDSGDISLAAAARAAAEAMTRVVSAMSARASLPGSSAAAATAAATASKAAAMRAPARAAAPSERISLSGVAVSGGGQEMVVEAQAMLERTEAGSGARSESEAGVGSAEEKRRCRGCWWRGRRAKSWTGTGGYARCCGRKWTGRECIG